MTRLIEKYDINEDCWTISTLKMPYDSGLHGVCLIPYESKVILFAGQNGQAQPIKKVSVFDLENETITEISEMTVNGGCVVDHAKLYQQKILCYVFDGFCIRSLVSYDYNNNEWKKISNS